MQNKPKTIRNFLEPWIDYEYDAYRLAYDLTTNDITAETIEKRRQRLVTINAEIANAKEKQDAKSQEIITNLEKQRVELVNGIPRAEKDQILLKYALIKTGKTKKDLLEQKNEIETKHDQWKTTVFTISDYQLRLKYYAGLSVITCGIGLWILNSISLPGYPSSIKLSFFSFTTVLATLGTMIILLFCFEKWYQYRHPLNQNKDCCPDEKSTEIPWDCGVFPSLVVGGLSAAAYAYFVCTNAMSLEMAALMGALGGALGGLITDSFLRSDKTYSSLPHALNMAVNAAAASSALVAAQSLTNYFASTAFLADIDWRMILLVDICVVSVLVYMVKGLANPLYQANADKPLR
ncbi:MAG: hypothetical protein JSS50_01445 [Proteobacteria bacterium]|nr:hypothetical protein [Pseudomonadota bacterium]